ncbi:MAG: GntR family transcriptional regulator [Chloroflexota bacterium]|nr:GntR family transcriptional regulator [Chloroflexota bacterium]
MAIWLDVNKSSSIPIYVQLVDQIKHALEVGILLPGDKLPTVRQLANELTIAPNTIVKAYGELDALGLIESRVGSGTVVVGNLKVKMRPQQHEGVFERLHNVVKDAASLEISEQELNEHYNSAVRHFYGEANVRLENKGAKGEV